MKISCLLVSHNKPTVHEAIDSVMKQYHKNWELFIMDSGVFYDSGEFDSYKDPRINFYRSDETTELKEKVAIAPYCYNQLLELVDEESLVVYLCDDDLFYPNAFHDFDKFMTNNSSFLACYGSQDYGILLSDNNFIQTGERLAFEVCGPKSIHRMDCRVDYLQFCHRAETLRLLDAPYWDEDKKHSNHSDGLFMEKIAKRTHVYPIVSKIGVNRRTTWSVNIVLEKSSFKPIG